MYAWKKQQRIKLLQTIAVVVANVYSRQHERDLIGTSHALEKIFEAYSGQEDRVYLFGHEAKENINASELGRLQGTAMTNPDYKRLAVIRVVK